MYGKGSITERSTFQIMPEIAQKIASNLSQVQGLEDKVIQDWHEELNSTYSEYQIIRDKIDQITENLLLFTSRMFIRHGVECVALLYPDEQKTREWLERIEGSIVEGLPRMDSFTDAVIRLEVPRFFKSADPYRRAYVTSLFNSSFFWHMIQVDERCSKLLREKTKGQKLCLDNNVLQSLVGFDGAYSLQSAHSMLRMARELGYDLWVTTKSIDEFHASLNWQMRELKKKPRLPAELARIAVENLDDDSFLAQYWREFVRHGTSIEEFVLEKSHLEDVLQGLDIHITGQYRKDIEKSQELLQEMSILRSVCGDWLSEHIIEHDAFHRIFINKVRGDPKYHFSDATAWFLTNDSKLPAYDRVARKGTGCLPFCITSDQWAQVNRPLLARTANQEEYEQSFHILVTQPFLRTMMPTFSLERAYNEVLGKLNRYKNISPQLALNLVADKHFMIMMASETDEQKIEEKIENKFIDIATQLRQDVQSKQERLEKLEETARNLDEKVAADQKRIEVTETSYQGRVKELEKNLKEERARTKAAEEARDQSEAFKKKLVGNLIKWSIYAVVLGAASAFLWLRQQWLSWPWLDAHKNKSLIEAATQLLLIFAFMSIPLPQHWQLWLGSVVTIILGIFALAVL